ncbi:hypothetical protein [Streptomyces oceani]|nr:hypothetical protein [Streptomyces oceani]
MCEHDAATAALGEGLAVAERQFARDRVPTERGQFRPWLYALSRWACLRRLSAQQAEGRDAAGPRLSSAAAIQRRRDLGALAWPEAAGTTPEQREALELSVRHGLPVTEVATVLSLRTEAASDLLTSAACEVERTRAALAVVESGNCPAVARLAGDDRLLLGAALRRELVRHVDECGECRRDAEHAMAGVSWPGTAPRGGAPLAVLEAPRPAVYAALHAVRRARFAPSPRFGRNGFPLDPADRAVRRERLRSRAVTTTVVATVIATPALALWAAYRGAPLIGEGHEASPVSVAERDEDGGPYEKAGRAGRAPDGRDGAGADEVDVRVTPGPGATAGSELLRVEARYGDGATLITLTAGAEPVSWSAATGASWLSLGRTAGTLEAGASVTLTVSVDAAREPAGEWAASVRIGPVGAVVTLEGRGGTGDHPEGPGGSPGTGQPSDPGPSRDPEPSAPSTEPSPEPSAPSTEPEPSPSDSASTSPSPPRPSDPAPSPPSTS